MEEHRFLNSEVPVPERPEFRALGHAGSDHYVGLELFPNPGCAAVEYFSDEVTSHCPITGQPDFYEMKLTLLHTESCIESKSLKLWLRQFSNPDNALFCEGLAVFIQKQVGEVLGYDEDDVGDHIQVVLTQKPRGGISIKAVA